MVGSARSTRTDSGTTPERPLVRTAPQPVSAPACERTASGDNIRQPLKVLNVPPMYPDTAAPAAGIVVVDARIGTDGTIVSAVAREPANPDLASAAVAAIEQWRFTPTPLNCVPVEVAMTASFEFSSEG